MRPLGPLDVDQSCSWLCVKTKMLERFAEQLAMSVCRFVHIYIYIYMHQFTVCVDRCRERERERERVREGQLPVAQFLFNVSKTASLHSCGIFTVV